MILEQRSRAQVFAVSWGRTLNPKAVSRLPPHFRIFDQILRPVACCTRNMDARLMDNATLAEVMQVKPVSDAEVAAIQVVHGEGI